MNKTGPQLRDEGISKAEADLALARWREQYDIMLQLFAAGGSEFTAEQVTEALQVCPRDIGARTNASVGGRILAALRSGLIVRTGYRNAKRPNMHASVVGVYVGSQATD